MAGLLLERIFGAGSLAALRSAVADRALSAGVAPERVGDVVIAVHELAANAVRHGAGRGVARMWRKGPCLCCVVSDDGPPHGGLSREAAPWPEPAGHGLWVARQVADEFTVVTGEGGTFARACFAITGRRQEENHCAPG
jgi:anti-sigma regulatory factor (Ser/Thr protein kinase)